MQKISKKILDYFIEQNQGCAFECYYDSDIEDLANAIGHSYEDTSAAAYHLSESGYLQSIRASTGLLVGYKLSHKGQYYKAFHMEKILSFLLKSIFVPIVVAFITALLTS